MMCGAVCRRRQVLRGERYGLSADVYSLGVIIWEMQSRERPFATLNYYQIISHVRVVLARLCQFFLCRLQTLGVAAALPSHHRHDSQSRRSRRSASSGCTCSCRPRPPRCGTRCAPSAGRTCLRSAPALSWWQLRWRLPRRSWRLPIATTALTTTTTTPRPRRMAAAAARVSHSCACNGSLCLRHCVHGASIGGGGGGGGDSCGSLAQGLGLAAWKLGTTQQQQGGPRSRGAVVEEGGKVAVEEERGGTP
jgi:hypothetical protein